MTDEEKTAAIADAERFGEGVAKMRDGAKLIVSTFACECTAVVCGARDFHAMAANYLARLEEVTQTERQRMKVELMDHLKSLIAGLPMKAVGS